MLFKKNVIKQLKLVSQLKGNCAIDFYTLKVSFANRRAILCELLERLQS